MTGNIPAHIHLNSLLLTGVIIAISFPTRNGASGKSWTHIEGR